MKRLFIVPLAFSMAVLPGLALAHDTDSATTTSLRGELKQDKKEIRQDAKAFRQEKARASVQAVTNVMTNTVSRLENIESRLETRLNRIQITSTSTTATTSPTDLLNMSKTDLQNARAHIAIIKSIDLSGSSTTARTNFETIKKEAKVVMQYLRDARLHMLQAVHGLQKWERENRNGDNKVETND